MAEIRLLSARSSVGKGARQRVWEAIRHIREAGVERAEQVGLFMEDPSALGTPRRTGVGFSIDLGALCGQLDLPRPRLATALRELVRSELIEYTPPERCGGVRLISSTAEPPPVDFRALEKRRSHEYAKLERMVDYGTARRCRRVALLEYFGEQPASQSCGAGCTFAWATSRSISATRPL